MARGAVAYSGLGACYTSSSPRVQWTQRTPCRPPQEPIRESLPSHGATVPVLCTGPDQEPAAISVSNREVRQQQQQQQQQQGGRQPELPTRAARTHLGGQCSDGGIPSCPPDHGGWFPALGRLHAPHQQQQQQQLALCSASAAAPHGPQQKQQEQAQQDTEQDTRAVSSNPEGGARPRNVPLHGNEYGSSNGCEYDSDLDEQLEPPEYEAGYCYRRGDRVVWRGRHYVCRLSHQAPEGGPLQLVGVEEQEGERGESGSREEGQGVVESEGRRREDAQGAAGLGLGGCGGGSGGHGACDAAGRATRAAVRRRVCWELVEPEAQLQSGVGDAQGSSSSPSRPEAPGSSTPSAGCQPQSQSHPQPPAGPRCCCTGGGTGAPQALGAGRREPHAGRPIEGPVPLPHFGLPALGGSGSADDGDPSAEDGEGDGEADGGGKGRERAVTLLQPLAAGQPLSVGGVQAAANTSIATALAAAAPAPAACASAVAGDPHVWSRAC